MNQTLLIDFDKTFTTMEMLELLAEISLMGSLNLDRQKQIERIKRITEKGMNGQMLYGASLRRRFSGLQIKPNDLILTLQYLERHISPSFEVYREEIKKHADDIYIFSGGFREIIEPIVERFGIDPSHVYANNFLFDEEGNITGVNWRNRLAHEGGKARLGRELKESGIITSPIIAVGDGGTDLQLRENGIADYFFAFTETTRRLSVLERMQNTTNCFEATSFQTVADFLGWPPPQTPEGQKLPSLETSYPQTPMQWRK